MRRYTLVDAWNFVARRGEGECWPWRGYKNRAGYGCIQIAGRGCLAHRVIYAIVHPGSIDVATCPDKSARAFVLHRCDNPECCNPAHLFLGTYADNNRDARAKGRARGGKHRGEARWNAKLNAQKAEEIRWIASKGIATTEIAPLYGVCPETVRKVVIGRAY